MKIPLGAIVAIALVLAACGDAAAQAPTPDPAEEPLAVEASALVPIDNESSIEVHGLEGQIVVSAHEHKELRVVSRAGDAEGKDVPVAIWQRGSTLVIGPAPGAPTVVRNLRIGVPASFAVTIKAARSEVALDGIAGAIDFDGDQSRLRVFGCPGTLSAEVTGGEITASGSGDAQIRAHDAAIVVAETDATVVVHASGGTLALNALRGPAEVEADDTQVTIESAARAVEVTASKGSVQARGLAGGGEFRLTGTGLTLIEGKGDITVTSDAPVEFKEMAAALHFDLYGGSLRGKTNKGILEVRTRNTEINVEAIEEAMRVQGEGVHARIVDVGGELYVEASNSDFVIDKPATVDVHLDRGSLSVQRAQGPVKAVVAGADAHILDGVGSVQLDLDGGDAEVSWSSLSADKDSQIVNKSGGVMLRLPASAVCRIEAKTKYGRILSSFPTVRIMDDQQEAQGPVNNGSHPVVHIVAAQDIQIVDAQSAPEEPN